MNREYMIYVRTIMGTGFVWVVFNLLSVSRFRQSTVVSNWCGQCNSGAKEQSRSKFGLGASHELDRKSRSEKLHMDVY